jgi:L-amino acid N-acyltransferase YncA
MAWSGPGGSPLGYVLAQAMPADAAYFTDAHVYIHDIYLVPDARGTGLADTLVSRVREWAAARGLRSFRALIASKNPQSLAFFARLGFRQTAIEVSNEWP